MKRKVTLIFFMLPIFYLWSQDNFKVEGVVTDAGTSESMPGAYVFEKGTSNGTVTGLDGQYSLTVSNAQGELEFSSMGYTKQTIAINNRSVINTSLSEDKVNLEDVVVIGYGTVKKKDITGSVSSIGSDDILNAPVVSLDAGMQGKLAGVTLQKTSGAPGQGMKMRIRGGGSINYSNQPLFVIDGFIGGDINSVNPNDIERIDILKDASATAIYGSRGANGVVLVTTKTAKKGESRISLDATFGISNITKQYDMLDAGTSAEYWNEGVTQLNELTGTNTALYFSDEELDYFKKNGGENYLDLITRTAYTQNYNLSMSGGSEKMQYLVSGGYLDEEGLVQESSRKKYSMRANIAAEVKSWLDLKLNTYATRSNYMNTTATNRAIMDAYMYPIFWPNKDDNGKYIYSGNSTYDTDYYVNGSLSNYNGLLQQGTVPNPIQYNEARAHGENISNTITSSLDLIFKLTKHLQYTLSGSGRYYSDGTGLLATPDGVYVKNENEMIAEQTKSSNTSFMTTSMLSYKNQFGKHDFGASVLYEYSTFKGNYLRATSDSLATLGNDWYILNNGNARDVVSTYSEKYMQSYMARVNYGFDGRYLLTASARIDQSSVFAKGSNQTGFFPSAALGWVISEESFMSSADWVSNLKLRVSAGATGNEAVGPYATKSGLQLPTGYYGYLGYVTYNSNDTYGGVLPEELVRDENLKWETTIQSNIGVDFSILEGKVNIIADVYDKTTKDVILNRSLPKYTGYGTIVSNFGTIQNRGVELSVDWQAIQGKDFSMRVGANASMNRNKVLDLGDDNIDEITLDIDLVNQGMYGTYSANNPLIIRKGESMGMLYGIKQIGLWSASEAEEAAKYGSYAGMPKYDDVDGDYKIDGNDCQKIGETQPKMTYGLNIDMTYKDFTLNIGAIGSAGNEMYNYTRHYMDDNVLNPDYNDRWSATNPDATQQRIPIGTLPSDSYISSQYVENASFFKINNLTLSYNLPSSFLSKLHIGSASVFANANNLLTITKYSGLDPENSVTDNNSDAISGIDSFSYPLARTYTFGLKANF